MNKGTILFGFAFWFVSFLYLLEREWLFGFIWLALGTGQLITGYYQE